MRHVCTVSDYGYLSRGLALYNSLVEYTPEVCLHYLCIDGAAYRALKGLNLPAMQVYDAQKMKEFKIGSSEYIPHSSNGYTEKQHYCWSLASRFLLFLLKRIGPGNIIYADADLCFYGDAAMIDREVVTNGGRVGIVPHLHNDRTDSVGAYNVGAIYFTHEALDVLQWWKSAVCNPRNPDFKNYGTCGDQKYLDLFQDRYKGVHVLGKTFSQGAPWNYRLYDWIDPHTVILRDRASGCHGRPMNVETLLLFAHFSHYEMTGSNSFNTGEKNYGAFLQTSPHVRALYDEYHQKNIVARRMFS